MAATLFRGPSYGALALIHGGPGKLVTIDHGIEEAALEETLNVLERLAEGEVVGDGEAVWSLRAHDARVLSSVEGALRRLGYEKDPLAERAIIQVDESTARRPDLPGDAKMTVSESVARGFHSLIHLAECSSGIEGPKSTYNTWPRPNAADAFGQPLPFLRVVIEGKAEDPDKVKQYLRDALAETPGLVRVSAVGDQGRVMAEVAAALPAQVLDEFAPVPILGPPGEHRRNAVFSVEQPIPIASWVGLEERALEAGAAVELTMDGRVVSAVIPCNEAAYMCLSERVRWLNLALAPWGGALEEVV